MATNNNLKAAAELRIGTVKATVWENEVGGITHHNATFSRIYPDGGQWKTTQSFRFVNLLSVAKLADQAHTLIAERKAVPARGRHALSETITAGWEIGLAGGLGRGLDEDDGGPAGPGTSKSRQREGHSQVWGTPGRTTLWRFAGVDLT